MTLTKNLLLSTLFLAALLSACKARLRKGSDLVVDVHRVISFAGYRWLVKSSNGQKVAPGHNYFSDSHDNVWVDSKQRLHLRITHKDGKWNCAEVIMMKSYSYDDYTFHVDSRIDNLDKNVVGGLFTYQNDSSEIDIEFSKWSLDSNNNSQFVTQPGILVSNKRRFQLGLTDVPSTHHFKWTRDSIVFESYRGSDGQQPASSNIIQRWTYKGPYVPKDADETVRLNLWLFRGAPPSDGKETEMVISGFSIR